MFCKSFMMTLTLAVAQKEGNKVNNKTCCPPPTTKKAAACTTETATCCPAPTIFAPCTTETATCCPAPIIGGDLFSQKNADLQRLSQKWGSDSDENEYSSLLDAARHFNNDIEPSFPSSSQGFNATTDINGFAELTEEYGSMGNSTFSSNVMPGDLTLKHGAAANVSSWQNKNGTSTPWIGRNETAFFSPVCDAPTETFERMVDDSMCKAAETMQMSSTTIGKEEAPLNVDADEEPKEEEPVVKMATQKTCACCRH